MKYDLSTLGGRLGAARDPTTPPDVMAVLAVDRDWCVRWRVADNPAAPADVLARLASDPDAEVRARAAMQAHILRISPTPWFTWRHRSGGWSVDISDTFPRLTIEVNSDGLASVEAIVGGRDLVLHLGDVDDLRKLVEARLREHYDDAADQTADAETAVIRAWNDAIDGENDHADAQKRNNRQ